MASRGEARERKMTKIPEDIPPTDAEIIRIGIKNQKNSNFLLQFRENSAIIYSGASRAQVIRMIFELIGGAAIGKVRYLRQGRDVRH